MDRVASKKTEKADDKETFGKKAFKVGIVTLAALIGIDYLLS